MISFNLAVGIIVAVGIAAALYVHFDTKPKHKAKHH